MVAKRCIIPSIRRNVSKEGFRIGTCRECGASLGNGQTLCEGCKTKADAAPARTRSVFRHACARCGALLPEGEDTCLVCRAAHSALPDRGAFPVLEETAYPYPKREKTQPPRHALQQWTRWGSSLAGGFLAMLLIVTGVYLYHRYFDTSVFQAENAILYEDDGQLMLTYPEAAQPAAVHGMEERVMLEDGMQASPNGRWLAVTCEGGALYLLDFTDLLDTENENQALKAQLLAEGLQAPAVFSDTSDYLVYLDDEGSLYASYMGDVWQLDTGVVEVVAVEERRVLYMRRGNRPGQRDLYLDYLPKDGGEWHVVDRDIREVLDWSDGFEQLMYTGDRVQENGETTTCLQLYELNRSSSSTLATGVGKVLDASAANRSAMFLSPGKHVWRYTDFINDDVAFHDAHMAEPLLEQYPLVEEILSWYGGDEEAMQEGIANDETYLEEYMEYRDALDAWEAKRKRDTLRDLYRTRVVEMSTQIALCELYAYHNNELMLLDTDVLDIGGLSAETGRISAVKGYATYQRADIEAMTATTMSTLWNTQAEAFDPIQYVLDNAGVELYYTPLDGKPTCVYIQTEDSTCQQWRVAPNADAIYFLTEANGDNGNVERTLYIAPLRNNTLGAATVAMRGVDQIVGALRDGVLFTAQEGAWFAQGETLTGLSAALPLPEVGNTSFLLYYGAGNDDAAPLYMLTREEQLLAEDVVGYWHPQESQVYFARAGQQRVTVDLYIWKPGGEMQVAEEVRMLAEVPPEEA